MRAEPPPDHAILDAWREQGADRLDPYAFHCMQALRRRAAERDGATRRALEEKLTERIQAYAEALARGAHVIATPVRDACRARGPLGELAAELGARSAQRGKASDGAAAGMGVALVRLKLGAPWLENGTLVRLFDTDTASPHAHYLCWRTGTMDRWECAAFAEWLRKTMA